MRLRIFYICCFVFQAVLSYSQKAMDSIYVFKQDQRLAESMILSPTNRLLWDGDSYGILQLEYDMDRGDFRKAQQAYDHKRTSFIAKGFNVLGKFHIGARFEFNNTNEDSLANGLRNDLEELATFYPYANKSGNYQRQNYILNAALGYDLTTKITAFLKLDYQRHWSAGTVDPRLRSDRFVLKARPGVSYHFSKGSVGLYGLIGKADEKLSLTYKNRVFKESLLYPDRMYHMNYGYGSSAIKDSSNNNKEDSYKGLGIEYATKIRDWKVQFSGEYELYHNTNQVHPKTSIYYVGPLAIYDEQRITGDLSLYRNVSHGKQHSVYASAQNRKGTDGNILTTGSLDIVNYRVDAWDLTGLYSFLWGKDAKVAKEISAEFFYNSLVRKDFLQSVTLDAANILLSVSGNWYVRPGDGKSIKIRINPYLNLPNRTDLKYSEVSKSEFLKNVVFTDYYYYKTRYWGAKFGGEYGGQFFGKNNFAFYVSLDYKKAIPLDLRTDLDPTFVPAGNRISTQLGIRMYLNAK